MAIAHASDSLVAAGCDDGSVRIWDLQDGTVRRAPLKTDDGPVTALAAGLLDSAPVLVSTTHNGPVRAWQLDSGTPIGPPLAGEDPVAVSAFGGRLVVISCDVRGRTCVRDPVTVRVLVTFEYSGAPVTALAVTRLHGRPVVVSGDSRGQMAVGDVATGDILARITGGHEGQVGTIVTTVVEGRSVAVSGANDGTVRRWDLASGAPLGTPSRGHHGPLHAPGQIYALTTARLGGRSVAVSSGWDGELWVWDLARGARLGGPLDDNHGDVQALTIGHSDGRQVVVCGGIDEPVLRVWDLDRRTLDRVLPSPAHVLALARLPAGTIDNYVDLLSVSTLTMASPHRSAHTVSGPAARRSRARRTPPRGLQRCARTC